MDNTTIGTFTDEDFWELIKNDPKAIKEYKEGLELPFDKGIYSEKELIKRHLKRAKVASVYDLTLPELMRLSHFLIFIHFLP